MVMLKGGGRCVYTLDLRGICKGDAAWVWGMTTLMVHADAAAAAAAAAAADCITHASKSRPKTKQFKQTFSSFLKPLPLIFYPYMLEMRHRNSVDTTQSTQLNPSSLKRRHSGN